MKKSLLLPLLFGVFVFVFASPANAQKPAPPPTGSATVKALKTTGRAAVVVVGQTAEAGYKLGELATPWLLKATEKTGAAGFSAAKFLVKKSFPPTRKLIVGYFKSKLPL